MNRFIVLWTSALSQMIHSTEITLFNYQSSHCAWIFVSFVLICTTFLCISLHVNHSNNRHYSFFSFFFTDWIVLWACISVEVFLCVFHSLDSGHTTVFSFTLHTLAPRNRKVIFPRWCFSLARCFYLGRSKPVFW